MTYKIELKADDLPALGQAAVSLARACGVNTVTGKPTDSPEHLYELMKQYVQDLGGDLRIVRLKTGGRPRYISVKELEAIAEVNA